MAKRMAEQMELFEPVERGFDEGGLMEEGGMVDEESGNEVPPGSLREEVRDDIPAQLSEGEFVFPADVVRYIGLENLMRMRQEAKQGLAQMEAMGQMGNGDEAVMPDDLPFDMYDLDIDDEEEYNSETRNYQVGGYVPPSVPQQPYNQPTQVDPRTGTYTLPGTGIAGYQVPSGTPTGYTPYGGAQPYFQPVQFTGPQFQTALQTTNLPTFAETVGSKPGQYDELRTYVNDAGQTLQIPFKDGRPIYPIPEGYRPIGDQPAPEEEEQVTVAPTLGETTVRDDGGRDRDGPAPGGSRDVTGIGYNKSGLIDSLSKTISKYGTGFGVLAEAVSGISPISIASQIMGKPVDTKVSSNTSAAFGGVLDAFRGMQGTPADLARQAIAQNKGVNQGFRQYENTTSLSNMEKVDQAVIAGYAEVVMPDIMKSFVNADGSAKSSSQTNSELRDALSDLGLSKSDIDAIANAGGNYNQNQKLSRALGNIAVKDIQSTTNKDLIDKVSKAVVAASEEAKAAEEAGNVARDAGLVGVDLRSDAGQKAVDAAKAAADAAFAKEQKAFEDAMKAAGKPDVSGATPAPSSKDEGGSGGQGGMSGEGDVGEGTGTDCLTEKMKVKLNGVVDFVTNIKVGDMIDGSVVKEVLHKHMRSGYFLINNELEITNDHPVLANGAWTKPEELYIGDYINDVKVESIKYIDRMTPTVSIVIDGDSFDVYTEGNTYTVHGRYREVRQQAA